jgi:voltage-gated potassium channel
VPYRVQTPLDRVRGGAIVLVVAILLGTIGYHTLGGYGWREALWMVVITVSTVGYSEQSQSDAAVQLLTMVVILVGISSAAYTFTGFIQLALEGELEKTLGTRRMTRHVDKLQNHVIICGMGRSGRSLARELKQRGHKFVIVEKGEGRIEEARALEFPAICGNATEESVLREAGIDRARALVSSLPSDADNVFITLTARELNKNLLIIASAEHESTAKKLHQAGAQKVVMPARVSAIQMSRMILHPSTADLMELVAESSYLDLELDELSVPQHPGLVGVSVRETEAHRKHKLLVVAVRQENGDLIFNPDADYTFLENDLAIVMGSRAQIDQFRSLYRT